MNPSVITKEQDPMGAAIADYHQHHKADKLRVFSSFFDEDEIPVSQLFRSFKQMSVLERKALEAASGKILDVGAGSGCHSIALQEMNKEVTALDISPLSVQVMKERGVKRVIAYNFFDEHFTEKFDTILMLMNGSGIIGTINNLPTFFHRIDQLLTPNGCVLMDSSDLRYLYENEDGSYDIDLAGNYYGEIDFQMQYKDIKGESFNWLYIDFETLSLYAAEFGFNVTLVHQGKHYDYLASIARK